LGISFTPLSSFFLEFFTLLNTMQLSPNFTLEEMVFSQTATRQGINNTPDAQQIENLRNLCTRILQPVRDKFGPIRISSGFRCRRLNSAVGGSSTSDHCYGFAADIIPLAASKKEVAQWIAKNCQFHQLIMEFGERDNPSWIHISNNPKNAHQILWAHGKPTRYSTISL
jgi:hypothetical protein